jgi:hypothetical protein
VKSLAGITGQTCAISLASCVWPVLSCSASAAQVPSAAPPDHAPVATFSDDTSRLPRYRSKRLGLSLPLPDGRAWRIDDHSRPELVATHLATRSTVVVAVLRTPANVGRTQCEDLARDAHLVPAGALQTLDEETTVTQGTFDTEVRVALQVGGNPGEPLVGHVLAFGGSLRKCYVFDFATEVEGAADEPALSARLAFARTRILGGLELDALATPSRADPHPRGGPPAP